MAAWSLRLHRTNIFIRSHSFYRIASRTCRQSFRVNSLRSSVRARYGRSETNGNHYSTIKNYVCMCVVLVRVYSSIGRVVRMGDGGRFYIDSPPNRSFGRNELRLDGVALDWSALSNGVFAHRLDVGAFGQPPELQVSAPAAGLPALPRQPPDEFCWLATCWSSALASQSLGFSAKIVVLPNTQLLSADFAWKLESSLRNIISYYHVCYYESIKKS